MDRYIKLCIPFGSKNYIKNKPNAKGMYCKGVAYYIFDLELQQYVHDYIQINISNYRVTDYKLLHSDKADGVDKPTDYYSNTKVKYFRDNYLDVFSNNTNPEDYKEITFMNLTPQQIKEVNQYFLEVDSTVRNMYSYLAGSNFTGAQTFHKASQILCLEYELAGCNFANPIKYFEAKKKDKTRRYPKDIKEYHLSEFIEQNIIDGFRDKFYQYNVEEEFKDNEYGIEMIEENIEEYIVKDIDKFVIADRQYYFIESIINRTMENYESYMNSNKLTSKLRSFYRSNVQKCINEHTIPLHSTIKKYTVASLRDAHIIQFAELRDKMTMQSLIDAVNPFNCLRIDNTAHDLWDNHEIYFDKDGYIVRKSGKRDEEQYLDFNNMPALTKKFYKQYLDKNKDILERSAKV